MVTIKVQKEMDFEELYKNSWGGAVDTLDVIEEAGLEDTFMDLLSEVFGDEAPTDTELNDYIWFECESIYEMLGLEDEED